jgi:tetratricopeptide (TPR) repeat protein
MRNRKPFFQISLTLVAIIILSLSSAGNLSAQEKPKDMFHRAQQLYDKAIGFKSIGEKTEQMLQLFEEAEAIFINLIQDYDYHNTYLYYNLGNCNYHLGSIGEAIYYYRIAQSLDPSFSDVRTNLNQARSLVEGYIEDEDEASILEVLFFWHNSTDVGFRLWIGVGLFVLVWISAFFYLFFRRKFYIPIMIILALFCVMFLSSVAIQYVSENNWWWGVVTDEDGAEARGGPGINYKPRFDQKLSEGIEFEVVEKSGDWLKIRLKNDEIGWIERNTALIHRGVVSFK